MGRSATHSASEIIGAREAAAAALDEAGLDNYLFSVEPREECWQLKVEHPVREGWESVTVPIDGDLLLASRTDRDARRRLAERFRQRLSV